MIQKVLILLWIEELEEGGCWIALVALADLVDFVDQNQGVFRLGLLQALNHFARHCTDVGPTVAFNFSHVRHTTDTESEILHFITKKKKNNLS